VLASGALSLANYCREALPRYRLAMQSVRIRSAGNRCGAVVKTLGALPPIPPAGGKRPPLHPRDNSPLWAGFGGKLQTGFYGLGATERVKAGKRALTLWTLTCRQVKTCI